MKTYITQTIQKYNCTELDDIYKIEFYRYTCLLLILMPWYRQAIFESKGDKLSSSAECSI